MPEVIQNMWNKIREYWAELEKAQKIRLYITAGILLSAIVVGLIMALRVEYVPVLSSTDDAALNEIRSVLNQDGTVKYKLEGNTILVDSKSKRDVEVRLLSSGIGGSDVKFSDTLDQISLTTTEKTKEEIFKNHYKNELQAKLKKLDFVKDAQVMYTTPEKSIWADPNQQLDEGSAYVQITSDRMPTDSQVEGVLRICSAALGIPVSKITVVDKGGNVLNKNTGNNSFEKITSQEDMRIRIADYYENKIYGLFAGNQAKSFDNIRVSVNPNLYLDNISEESTRYGVPSGLDGTGALTDREYLKETMQGGTPAQEPGIGSNPGTVPSYQTTTDATSNYSKTETKEHFEWDVTNTSVQKAIGHMNQANSTATLVIWYGSVVAEPAALTEQYIENMKNMVYGVTGIPADKITVSILENAAPEPVMKAWTEILAEMMDTYGFFALIVLLMIVLAVMAIPRKKTEEEEDEDDILGPQFISPEGHEGLPEIELEEQNEIKKQIERFVNEKPDAVAQLLRNWLQDDWE